MKKLPGKIIILMICAVIFLSACVCAMAEGETNALSKSYSLSDVHIFLPAAGFCMNGATTHENSYGDYWSSNLWIFDNAAIYMRFGSAPEYQDNAGTSRSTGLTIRAVCQ